MSELTERLRDIEDATPCQVVPRGLCEEAAATIGWMQGHKQAINAVESRLRLHGGVVIEYDV